ncbi:hypothetical protein N825_06055 [Skermanella stibiiresistens SB22]|uniref:Membrane-anchored protein n=1 Tax=Skermanella stibiiresistens SB22 TaxID=1385369 RepID=W9H7C7_9PROT|nr:hypothetical protein [Skermanella stibiiresistens]EWY39688.1 hypothetical protein N825_06055 [Skermanella stibiiresistens SB22]
MSAALQTLAPQPADIEGRIDAITGGKLYGWAWDRARPSDHLEVEIRVGDRLVTTVFANQPRDDLKANGVGDGCHSFELALELAEGETPIALARSPVTGDMAPLRMPSDVETVAENVIGPVLLRLSALMDATQRNQQTVLRGLRELLKQGQAAPANDQRNDARIDGIVAAQEELQRQVSGIEVFLLRIDESLHDLNVSLKQRPAASADKRVWIALSCLAAAVVATGAAMAWMRF